MNSSIKNISCRYLFIIILGVSCSSEIDVPWDGDKYFRIIENSDGVKRLYSPDEKEFYLKGIVYAPLEGKGPDYQGDLYGELTLDDFNKFSDSNFAPPVRNTISGLQEDLDLIDATGFNQIKLWNVVGLSRLGLLRPFLLEASKRKVGVMLALTGPNDGWQLSKDSVKLKIFESALEQLTLEVKGISSVISINVYAPEIRDNYPTRKTKEVIGAFAKIVKRNDPRRLVAVFIDRDPLYFKFPSSWTEEIDLIGIQPYSIQEKVLDIDRINNDVNYYVNNLNKTPVYIDEWGLRSTSVIGTHSLVSKETIDTRLLEFLNFTKSLEIIGWSYFMLRDKVWEGDYGLIGYDSNTMIKKSTYSVMQNYLNEN